jgi:hypothetical protein
MTEQEFQKILTANDTGYSKSHQAGIHVPKGQRDLIAFLPALDLAELNPSAWLKAIDDEGTEWQLRYVYYNNKLHKPSGTRDEYRITHLTKYFRASDACPGDLLIIFGKPRMGQIRIRIGKPTLGRVEPRVVRLSGWRRVH